MAYESGLEAFLDDKLNVADTSLTYTGTITITAGRIYFINSEQEEWISFTGNTGTSLTGLTRGLSQTADPATAGTGKTWVAGSKFIIVAMHDQLFDRKVDNTVTGNVGFDDTTKPGMTPQSLTQTQIDALPTSGSGIVLNSTDGEYNGLQGGSYQPFASGSTQPNSSPTVAGKVETGTSSESIAATDVGGTGANNFVLPSDIAKNIQSGTFINGTATGADTKTMTVTPTLTAYGNGLFIVTNTTVNTGAVTLNIDTNGARDVKTIAGGALVAGDMANTTTYVLYNNGTEFILLSAVPAGETREGVVERLTDAEAVTASDTTRYPSIKQINDNYLSRTEVGGDATDMRIYGDADILTGNLSGGSTGTLLVDTGIPVADFKRAIISGGMTFSVGSVLRSNGASGVAVAITDGERGDASSANAVSGQSRLNTETGNSLVSSAGSTVLTTLAAGQTAFFGLNSVSTNWRISLSGTQGSGTDAFAINYAVQITFLAV